MGVVHLNFQLDDSLWHTEYCKPEICHKAQKFLSLLRSGIPVQNATSMRCLILIARTVKIPILRYLTLCNLVQMYRRFGRTCLLQKKKRRKKEAGSHFEIFDAYRPNYTPLFVTRQYVCVTLSFTK
jgi:hypothetical protein